MNVGELNARYAGDLNMVESSPKGNADDAVIYVPARPYWQWAFIVVAIAVLGMVAWSIIVNPAMSWGIVGQYLLDPIVLQGFILTVWLTIVTTMLGLVLGVILAVMRMSSSHFISGLSGLYIWFFRGTPLLVQLIMLYNLGSLFPTLSLSIPFGETLFSVKTNAVITPYVAAILGLALHEAAYMAEIVRGGLLALDKGQRNAADALGMTSWQKFWHIVLPQLIPSIIPPIGNQLIGMLKMTSLVSVIALGDLLYSVQLIYSRNYQTIPLLMVACFWYLVATTALSGLQWLVERRFGRGLVTQ
ncbi:ABC transporter permease [Kaistia sp. 32K]|uniref:amino acid ABC transporter permease n=1 Tax=Kaistia sp. 32K TaxID=2795690 RepID=UPI00193685D9|nr:amino acid ABC transporter permease [Kaistia sp. 32K]BCP56086.1 ABC transporter permease [Kaistia sp. 32K]